MNSRHYKTKQMQMVEYRIGQPIEEFISARYAAGLTQVAIAEELGITSGTVSKWMYQLGLEAHYGPKPKAAA